MSHTDYSTKKKKKYASFEEWSNERHGVTTAEKDKDTKKKKKYTSFEEWSNEKHGVTTANGEDITPVIGGNKDSWFKAGSFSDGYQVGDVTSAILGTAGDVGIGALKGIGRMAEGLVDLGTYGVAGIADLFGADEFAEKAKKVARYSATDEWTKGVTDYVDKYSLIGNKGDMISEGLGQVGAIILTGGLASGLGAVGATAVTTGVSGLSSMGTNMGEAYDAGATDEQAFLYGLGTGTIEAATELLTGGLGKGVKALGLSRGIGGLDDIFAKKLSEKVVKSIASESVQKVVGNTVEAAVKAGGEGVEEVLSGLGSAVMKKLTYMKDEDLSKLIDDENLLEQFVVGSVTSALAQGSDYIKANKSGSDFVTGRTDAEEKVVAKLAENEIAKREADGKKLTNKEKNKIYDDAVEDLTRGGISIDTIEEVLGGESLEAYKKAVDMKNEFNKLNGMKPNELTGAQSDRLGELKAMGDSKYFDEQVENAKKKLSDDVLSLVKGDRKGKGSLLMESYNERDRLYEDFKADYNKYKGTKHEAAARATIDNAIKAGANNTRKVHDLVDMTAKLSADTGEVFEFGDNESIKQGFIELQSEKIKALESIENPTEAQLNKIAEMKTVLEKVQNGDIKINGTVSSKGVVLNLDSPRALNRIVGHEIIHTFENAGNYAKLRDALFNYARAKGVKVDERLTQLNEIYKGIEGANPEGELTADLVGEYLFNDYDFVKRLSGDRNMFQSIWDDIKYLAKIVTSGSKEARELAKVERMFEKAYAESKTSNIKDGTPKYDIVYLDDGKVYVSASRKVITGNTIDEKRNNITNFFKELLEGNSSIDIQTIEGDILTITKADTADKARDNYKEVDGNRIKMSEEEFKVKLHAESHIDEIAETSTKINNGKVPDAKNHPFAKDGFTYRRAYFEDFDGQYYEITLSIGHNGTTATIYNVGKIKTSVAPSAKIIAGVGSKPLGATPVSNIISQKTQKSSDSKQFVEQNSLSNTDDIAPIGKREITGKEFRKQMRDDIAPVADTTTIQNADAENVAVDAEPSQVTPFREKLEAKKQYSQTEYDNLKAQREASKASFDEKIANLQAEYDGKKNKDTKAANSLLRRIENLKRQRDDIDADLNSRMQRAEKRIKKLEADLNKDYSKKDALEIAYERIDKRLEAEKAALAEKYANKKKDAEAVAFNHNDYVSKTAKKLYDEIVNLKKGVEASYELGYLLDQGYSWKTIKTALLNIKNSPDKMVNNKAGSDAYEMETIARELVGDMTDIASDVSGYDSEYAMAVADLEAEAKAQKEAVKKENERVRRKDLHNGIMSKIKSVFSEHGFDFDNVLEKGKRMHTFSINDNTPQRVNDKIFGYKEGELLNDLTFNRVALNESDGIKWLNDRVSSIRELSKKYNIKPASNESKAAQMYAEGFYVDESGDLITYGDKELAADFPDIRVQENIKGLARDPEVRRIYNETLDQINESRVRNGYPEIPKRDNYFLHFRAMEDTFSRLGLPFNPEHIKAKDLPTDINGMTADLKPGQPYFASANRRMGIRTSYDLLGGMERYMNAAKNQIYHIDDIQTMRALRNYIADRYGQANGLSDLDSLTYEEQEERIKDVFDGKHSVYAKYLIEYGNMLAGKTALIDRSIEGLVGRRAIQALKTFNSQVGKNQVGFNMSSAGTNFLPIVQATAKLPKSDMIKAFAQTISNRFKSDGFVENDPALIRRIGADKFNKTLWEKASDAGYFLMSAVDNFSSELIVRAKYNELVRNGMDSEKAHIRAGEWAMRLMGDRSLGQMPMQYNSAIMGLFNKYQLEVRNQLDSMGYDTIQENLASGDNSAKKAFRITKTMAELALFQHIFGTAYEMVAGYNPAFDIVSTIATLFGWDDEDDEDTFTQNMRQAADELLEDLPYANIITGGGRIPVSSALPIKQLFTGKDDYGNDVSFWETIGQAAGYALPAGYGQAKKTYQGLKMFDEDIGPVKGSYTDSGNLRFPVEDTFLNRVQAGLFGQYASKNARKYFDDDLAPLKPKQTQEFADSGMSFEDYHKYREGLSEAQKTTDEHGYAKYLDNQGKVYWYDKSTGTVYDENYSKADVSVPNLKKASSTEQVVEYINSLPISTEKKDILYHNAITQALTDSYGFEKYEADGGKYYYDRNNDVFYDEDYNEVSKELLDEAEPIAPMSLADYNKYGSYDEFEFANKSPEKYKIATAVGGYEAYNKYKAAIGNIESDKNKQGKTISGSKKTKVINYINDLDIDFGEKIILFRSEYPSDDTYNLQIVNYLQDKKDMTYKEKIALLEALGMSVDADGNVRW